MKDLAAIPMGASPIGRALVNFKHEGIINERNRYSKDGTSPILIDYAKALEVIKDYMSSFDVVTVKVIHNLGKDRIMISADNYD